MMSKNERKSYQHSFYMRTPRESAPLNHHPFTEDDSTTRLNRRANRTNRQLSWFLLGVGALFVLAAVTLVAWNNNDLGSSRSRSSTSSVTLLGSSHGHHTLHTKSKKAWSKLYHSIESTQAVAGLQLAGYPSPLAQLAYEKALDEMDWNAVEKDLEKLLTPSQDWW